MVINDHKLDDLKEINSLKILESRNLKSLSLGRNQDVSRASGDTKKGGSLPCPVPDDPQHSLRERFIFVSPLLSVRNLSLPPSCDCNGAHWVSRRLFYLEIISLVTPAQSVPLKGTLD